MKYIDRLQASEEELNEQQAASRAAEVQSEFEAKIANKKASITRLSNQVEATLNRYPLDINAVVVAQNKVSAAEEELDSLQIVYEDLFGASS